MGSSNLSLILHSRQGRSSSLGKSSPNLENFKFQNFGSNWKKVSMLLEMDFENKENIQIKTHPDMEFLSCSEIFCETLVESKPAKPAFIPQMYPKVLQVNAQVDPTLVEDNRVLLNLIRNESRYLPKYPDYFRCVQVEVKPHMRKIILEAGVNKNIKDSEGRTARELAINRDSKEMVELLSSQGAVNNSEVVRANALLDNPDPLKLGACAMPKQMTVEEEKEVLRRRLAELEEGETKSLENSLKEKRVALDKVKTEYRKQREVARTEIVKLEQKIKMLESEEEKKTSELV